MVVEVQRGKISPYWGQTDGLLINSHALCETKRMDNFIVGAQIHHIVYVACVGCNNQWKTYNAPNYLSWLEHIMSNDEIRGMNL